MKLEITARLIVDPAEKVGEGHIAVKIRFVPKGSGHRGKSRRLADSLTESGTVYDVVRRTSGVDCKLQADLESVLKAVEFLQAPTMRVAS